VDANHITQRSCYADYIFKFEKVQNFFAEFTEIQHVKKLCLYWIDDKFLTSSFSEHDINLERNKLASSVDAIAISKI